MAAHEHPDRERLANFALGLLDEEPSVAVEEHLQRCVSCGQELEALPAADTFVSLLRSAETLSDATSSGSAAEWPTAFPDARQWSQSSAAPPCPALGSTPPPELVNHPRYRVLELLGAGGMGAVYKAEHLRMQRTVALKTINAELVNHPEAVQRFSREIQAAAKLSHPHIVTAFDADQAGNVHFLVMEFAEGETLAQMVARRGPLSIAEACSAVRQAALGLQHAHERGMVHRDIKPQNLMVSGARDQESGVRGQESGVGGQESETGFSVVKILDFGLARFVQESSQESRTEFGTVMGTPDYMAPEQALDTREADIRADIYSLGCTLYFLLTGKPPFSGATAMEILMRHQSTEPRHLREVRPDAPVELERVLSKMLAKRPEHRFQTPAEVATALAPFTEWRRVPPPRGPRRRWLPAAVLAGAAALLCGVVIVIQSRNGNTTIKTDDNDAKVIVNGKQVYPEPNRDGDGKKPSDVRVMPPNVRVKLPDVRVKPPDVHVTSPVKAGTGKGVWELQHSGVKERLRDVAFFDDKTGLVVGDDSTLLKTADRGKTWRRVGTKPGEKKIDFGRVLVSGREAWAMTSILRTIWHSADAGDTWKPVALPDSNQAGNGSGHYSVVGSDFYLQFAIFLWKTSDTGRSWQQLTRLFPGASLDGGGLFFLDAKHGWYARMAGIPGQPSVARTTDGGKTWKTVAVSDKKNVSGNYVQVFFTDVKHGYLAPHFGTVLSTDDGGDTWTPQNLGHVRTSDLLAMRFLSPKIGHILCAHYPGEVRRTTDGGKTWQSLGKLSNNDHLYAMSFPSTQHGWVVGEHGFIEHYSEAKGSSPE